MAENEEKKETEEERKEDSEIAWVKKTMRKIREISSMGLLLSLLGILICSFASKLSWWENTPLLITILLWTMFGVSLLFYYGTYAVKFVKESENFVVRLFGGYLITYKAGLRIIFPPFMTGDFVDMREQEINIPEQEVITEDNVVVKVDGILNVRIFDAYKSLFNVKNPFRMLSSLGETNIRDQIGDFKLDEALKKRGELGEKVAISLNVDAGFLEKEEKEKKEIEDKIIESRWSTHYKNEKEREKGWGMRVTRARIKRIDPPDDIQEAMHKQATAERVKRAVKLNAEATRYQERVVAEGRAQGYKKLLEGLKKDDSLNTLVQLESLIALRMGMDGKATKIFLPSDPLLAAIAKVAEAAREKLIPEKAGEKEEIEKEQK